MSKQHLFPAELDDAGAQGNKPVKPRKNKVTSKPSVMGPTESLARFVAGLCAEALPAHIIERTKDLALDHLGVALYGTGLPWTAKVRELVLSEGGRAESTIYGSRRVPARNAALVNGAAAHAIELDDTHDESLSHPGSVIFPAAFAMAELLDRSGLEFLTAVVAGYEVQCRVGSALGHELIRRGFHPPSVCGVYGSVAAAGRLQDLDVPGLISAFGSGVSMSSGVMQFTQDPAGTMIKRLHTGLPAERGVLVVKLAADGFLGPKQAIEGVHGFAQVFTEQNELARITKDLGKSYEIERISIKLYACCKLFHSLIEAIANCREQKAFVADDVIAIEPYGPRFMIDTHMEYRPLSTMAAQYSLPYSCAAAIMLDPADPESFAESALANKDVLRLADLVKPEVDPELEAIFPRKFAGGVRIRLRDGQVLTSTVIESRSSPDKPIGRDDVQDKFRTLTAKMLSARRQELIINTVASLENAGSIRELTSLLRSLGSVKRGR